MMKAPVKQCTNALMLFASKKLPTQSVAVFSTFTPGDALGFDSILQRAPAMNYNQVCYGTRRLNRLGMLDTVKIKPRVYKLSLNGEKMHRALFGREGV